MLSSLLAALLNGEAALRNAEGWEEWEEWEESRLILGDSGFRDNWTGEAEPYLFFVATTDTLSRQASNQERKA